MTFSALGLSAPILKALQEQDYKTPSPIQAEAIPVILSHKDVMAAAQTGTGKTAGFTLPILQRLSQGKSAGPHQVRTLILAPTRELAAQVSDSVKTYGKHLTLKTSVVFGGVKISPQIAALRRGVDILIATPGRLLDLYQQRAMNFDQLEVLVLDEADRMLDMGFIHDIRKIIEVLPRKRQNLLFSATFSTGIRTLAKGLLNNPVEISVSKPNTTVNSVDQWVCPVDKKQKNALLAHLIWEGRWEQVLVFTRTKHGANRLAEFLIGEGIDSVAIHGNKSQGARTRALNAFKKGEVRALVATDIAARGLDIELLPNVVNFDLPQIPEDYVHRIGRTGRAGATGEAISLVSADEVLQLKEIERIINKTLPRKEMDGFEPTHTVPSTKVAAPKKAAPRRQFSGRGDRKESPRFAGERSARSEKSEKSEKRTDRKDTPRFDNTRRAKPGEREENPRFSKVKRDDKREVAEFDSFEKPKRSVRNATSRFDTPRRADKKETPRFENAKRTDRKESPRFDSKKRGEEKKPGMRFEKSDQAKRFSKKDAPRFDNTKRADKKETSRFDNAKRGDKKETSRFDNPRSNKASLGGKKETPVRFVKSGKPSNFRSSRKPSPAGR